MTKLLVLAGLMTLSSIASAAGVTKLQRQVAAKINNSAVAKRDGIRVKPSQITAHFLNGHVGEASALVKTNPGAFPMNVSVDIKGNKLSNVRIIGVGVPGREY